MTKFLNISTDTTLGGNSPSDETVSSQKALKTYIDAHSSGSVSVDGVTVSKNSSDELQAIGTINKNTAVGATNPKYDWVGTLAEYNAQTVATNHPDWICYITDDVSGGASVYTKAEVDSLISTTLSAIYPVGSIYIGTTSTCPMSSLISGSTWTLVSSGKVLQGADNDHAAGTTIAAGLPNITGGFTASTYQNSSSNPTQIYGSFATGSTIDCPTGGNNGGRQFTFDASRSSSIYGNSNTVQPPAYVVNIWERTL